MLDVDWKSDQAAEAYANNDFAKALLLMNEVIDQSPESPHGVASRHLRALAYESGNVPGGISLADALADFTFLAERSDTLGSIGLVGVARVLKKLDSIKNFDNIERLCKDALALDNAAEAALLLGDLFSEAREEESEARKWYWVAYRAGSVAGLLNVAKSHEREGNRVRAAVFAIIFALKSRPA